MNPQGSQGAGESLAADPALTGESTAPEWPWRCLAWTTSIYVAAGTVFLDAEVCLTAGGVAVAGGIAAAAVAMGLRGVRRRWLVVGLLATLLAFLGIYRTPWNTRKPFLRDFRTIQPGMTVAEARGIMARHIVGTCWPSHPGSDTELQLQNSMVYRHSDEGEFNADWGIVRIRDGRVVGTEFSAD